MKSITLIFISLLVGTFCYSQAGKFEVKEKVYIGPKRDIKSPTEYFKNEQKNVHVIIEKGTYHSDEELFIIGESVIVEGKGKVNLYCRKLYNNVMWVSGSNIIIKNIRMKHYLPGDPENQKLFRKGFGF